VATIPKALQEHIQTAYPANVCLVGTVLPNGYAQITPRGSTMVFDDEHFALWERGRGSTNANLRDGSKVTIFFRKPELRQSGLLPRGGIARFYGTAELHKSGAVRDQIWERLIEPEKRQDPERKGFGVLIAVERAEDLAGEPLRLD
jgi:hypothetical protein